jgi:MFS family permease
MGKLSDRLGRRPMLLLSLASLAAALALLAASPSIEALWLALVFYGLHMSLSQSVLSGFVADAAPADLRGTAFGFFGLVSGVAGFASSFLAGLIWQAYGAQATFAAGAALAVSTAVAGFSRGPSQPVSQHETR